MCCILRSGRGGRQSLRPHCGKGTLVPWANLFITPIINVYLFAKKCVCLLCQYRYDDDDDYFMQTRLYAMATVITMALSGAAGCRKQGCESFGSWGGAGPLSFPTLWHKLQRAQKELERNKATLGRDTQMRREPSPPPKGVFHFL